MFLDGSRIAQNGITGDGFYWIRGYQTIRLYHQGNIQAPLGSYCCRIPDSSGAMRTFCANLVGKTYSVKILYRACNLYFLAIECPSLGSPDNGMITYSRNPTNGSYILGTVTTYSCSPGFGLSSTQSRVCVGDGSSETVGRFNGSEPSCEGKE